MTLTGRSKYQGTNTFIHLSPLWYHRLGGSGG